MSNTLSRRDTFLLCLLTLIWGLNWPIMKIGVADFPAFTFRTVTMAGGLVVFALVARLQGHSLRVERAHWVEIAKLSTTNMAVWYALSIIGIKLLASGRAAILGYTLPVWVALIGFLVYRERQGVRLALALVAAAAAWGCCSPTTFTRWRGVRSAPSACSPPRRSGRSARTSCGVGGCPRRWWS